MLYIEQFVLCKKACIMVMLQVTNMKEIILIGSYQMTKQLNRFITSVQQEFKIVVRCVPL